MIKKIIFFLLFTCSAHAQQVALVHVNADFNKSNDWSGLYDLKNCKVYSGNIDKNPPLKDTHHITKVPTMILYVNGREEKRWEGGLDMKIHANLKEVQTIIDQY